jgi:Fic-DOC domain mobile mystery protein B
MSALSEHDDGATPLSAEELDGLIPTYITTREQLNEAEQANILKAETWAFSRQRPIANVLQERFVLELHRRMFGEVWRWAGRYRRSDKNIGIAWSELPIAVPSLLNDAHGWIEYDSYPDHDEFAIRFSHRLVAIHPFGNGNGRHSRMMADLLVVGRGSERFTWGSARLTEDSETRGAYIAALKAADNHDLSLLIAFARS